MWTHKPFPVALTFFWGLTLTIQGVITPALNEDVPHPRYFAFWALHLLIVWAAVYLVIGLGKVPRWRDYGAAVATTLGWAAATYALNVVADTNYGYLMRKPRSSILDLFGPWPWYVLQEIVLVVAVWALMTWVAQRLATHPSRGSHRRRARSHRSWRGTSRTAARTRRGGGTGSLMSQPSGARVVHMSSNSAKPGMDLAAIVRSGPAAPG